MAKNLTMYIPNWDVKQNKFVPFSLQSYDNEEDCIKECKILTKNYLKVNKGGKNR